jgi:2-dehydropantoate 2-reductase
MRFIVYGAGAVGGALGALLSLAGHQVTLIARGRHRAAIAEGGLVLSLPDVEHRLALPVVSGPGEVDWRAGDVVLLAMKSQDTEAALRELAAAADPEITVVCVQNGVANERAALRYFPDVYGVCVMFPATHLTPGVVAVHSAPTHGILDVGQYPTGVVTTRAGELAAAFESAGFSARPLADVMAWKHTKLLGNLGNALDAVFGSGPDVDEIYELVRAEGVAVLDAAGIGYATARQEALRRGDLIIRRPAQGQARAGGSSWQSLARGTGAIEADYLNGEIVLLGRLHGVPTPYNEHARRLAVRAAREGRPPATLPTSTWHTTLPTPTPPR